MLMIIARPPNYEEITARFQVHPFAVFTFGECIYNPRKVVLEQDVIEHEKVHAAQQRPGGPNAWWQRYLADPAFVLEQELEAYRRQYDFFCKTNRDRNDQLRKLLQLAGDLASPMYGSVIGLGEAMKAIQNR